MQTRGRRPGGVRRDHPGRPGALVAPALSLLLSLPGVAAADGGETFVRAPWGSGWGELGRRGGDESAPEGPMSFAVGPEGDVRILDQVNRRVVRFDAQGTPIDVLAVGEDTFQDVALAPGGEIVLLDRLAAKVVRVLDPDGRLVADVPLLGAGIAEGGGTTALFAQADGIWVEYEHRRSVRVADAQFRPPAVRDAVVGRPTGRPGVLAGARLSGTSAVEIWTVDRAADVILAETTLRFDEPVARISALGAGARGDVFCAVQLRTEGPPPDYEVVRSALVVIAMDAGLAERRRIETTPSAGAWEQFKEFEFASDGSIYQMAFVDEGVEVRRW